VIFEAIVELFVTDLFSYVYGHNMSNLLSQRAGTDLFKSTFFCLFFFQQKSACGQLISGLQAIENIKIKKTRENKQLSLFFVLAQINTCIYRFV